MSGETVAEERAWLERLPKAELHLHLEGAIPLETLWGLVRKYGGDAELPDIASLRERFNYKDFPHFIETWVWKNNFLKNYEDFAVIAEAVGRELIGQNVRYAEVFYSPADFARHGLSLPRLTASIREGFSRVNGVEVSLIADLIRDLGPTQAERTLEELAEVRNLGVVGIGLGGSEQKYPAELFRGAYERARAAGFHLTAHAGEAAGAESVRAAVEILGVERIGHGTRAFEDPALIELLAARRIPLEICPISNLRTGVVARLAEHPIRRYFDRGIPVTVNTDDPAMFGTSLTDEYLALRRELGFSREEIITIIRQGFSSSWASAQRKAELIAELDDAWATNRARPRSSPPPDPQGPQSGGAPPVPGRRLTKTPFGGESVMMPVTRPFLLYLRSRLNIAISLVSGALLLGSVFVFGPYFAAPAFIVLAAYGGVTLAVFFSRKGAREIVAESEEDRTKKIAQKIEQSARTRERISVLRIGDEEMRKNVEFFLLVSGSYIEKCRELGLYSPRANKRIEDVLEICQVFLGELDETATEKRYGVKDGESFEDFGKRSVEAVKDAASDIKAWITDDLVGLSGEDKLSIIEELEGKE